LPERQKQSGSQLWQGRETMAGMSYPPRLSTVDSRVGLNEINRLAADVQDLLAVFPGDTALRRPIRRQVTDSGPLLMRF
jgi:hypothetical protein